MGKTTRLLTLFTPVQALLLASLAGLALTQKPKPNKGAVFWRNRTIYQLLTDRFYNTTPDIFLRHWQGGTFLGMIEKLDYIKEMGFDAIWISPIVKNTELAFNTNGYHGYWMIDLYELSPHFGTSDDFKKLVAEVHKRDMLMMVDIVANHGGPFWHNFSTFGYPLNESKYFHPYCNIFDIDHRDNQWRMEKCWLAGLPDFNHEDPFVYDTLVKWIGNMTSYFDIDGLRIDTVPHVPHHFWADFNKSSNVFQVGECLDPRAKYVATYQNYLQGEYKNFHSDWICFNFQIFGFFLFLMFFVGMLNYPLYFAMIDSFAQSNSFRNLVKQVNENAATFRDHKVLGNFIDNHDHNRFLHDNGNRKNITRQALTFNFFMEGIPIMYYGTEQYFNGTGDPGSREPMLKNFTHTLLYNFTQTVVGIRKTNQVIIFFLAF